MAKKLQVVIRDEEGGVSDLGRLMSREWGPVDDFVREHGLKNGCTFKDYCPGDKAVIFKTGLDVEDFFELVDLADSKGLCVFFEGEVSVLESEEERPDV